MNRVLWIDLIRVVSAFFVVAVPLNLWNLPFPHAFCSSNYENTRITTVPIVDCCTTRCPPNNRVRVFYQCRIRLYDSSYKVPQEHACPID